MFKRDITCALGSNWKILILRRYTGNIMGTCSHVKHHPRSDDCHLSAKLLIFVSGYNLQMKIYDMERPHIIQNINVQSITCCGTWLPRANTVVMVVSVTYVTVTRAHARLELPTTRDRTSSPG